MPIYEYACKTCKAEFEILLRASERVACPSCGGDNLDKLLSVTAAPSVASGDLPVCPASPGGACGMGDCGMGGCPMQS